MRMLDHRLKTGMVFLFVIAGSIAINYSYQEKINELKAEVNELKLKNKDYQEAIQYISKTEKGVHSVENSYEKWKEKVEIATDFYQQSNEKFKKEWGLFLAHQALKYDIDPYIVFELLRIETGGEFDPNLIGPKTKYGHAYGLSQFMKNTAPWVANMAGIKYKDELLFDPYYSIQLSVVYLDFLYDRYNGNWDQALTAYNRGIYGLEKYMDENGHAKSSYAKTIINNAEQNRLIAYSE